MPNGHMEYSFNEPLLVCRIDGATIEAGAVDGVAEIDYEPGGFWQISDIYLDGWNNTARKFTAQVPVPANSEIYKILHERLTNGKTAEYIQSDIFEALENDRAYAEAAE